MNAKQKKVVILIAIAAAAYLGYRWWSNRQSNSSGTGLGANLNSLAPALVAGSTGPQSGLNYYAGSTSIYVTQPVNQSASKSSSTGPTNVNPGGPMRKPPPWVVH